MRLSDNTFAEVVVAVKCIKRVVKLGSCRVERRMPYLVNLVLRRPVAENEHLLAQDGVGNLDMIFYAFVGRGVGVAAKRIIGLECSGTACTGLGGGDGFDVFHQIIRRTGLLHLGREGAAEG